MNAFKNPELVCAILDTFAQFDYISMNALICMMVDTCAARYGENPVDIATTICDTVQSVNDELGAYHII